MFDTFDTPRFWILLFMFLGAARAARTNDSLSSHRSFREATLALPGPMCVLCRDMADRSECPGCNPEVSWPKRLSVTYDEALCSQYNMHSIKEQWRKYNGVYHRVSNTCSLCKGVGEYYGIQCTRCNGSSVGDAPYRYVRWCPNCGELGSTCKCVVIQDGSIELYLHSDGTYNELSDCGENYRLPEPSRPYQLRFGKLYPPEFYKKRIEELFGLKCNHKPSWDKMGKMIEVDQCQTLPIGEVGQQCQQCGGKITDELGMEFEEAMKYYTDFSMPTYSRKTFWMPKRKAAVRDGGGFETWLLESIPTTKAAQEASQLVHDKSGEPMGLWGGKLYPVSYRGPVNGFAEPRKNQQGLLDDVYAQPDSYGNIRNPLYYGTMPLHQHLPHTNPDPVPNEIATLMSARGDPCRDEDGDHQHAGRFTIEPVPEPVEQ